MRDRIVAVRPSVAEDYRAVALHQWGGDPNLVAVGLTDGLAVLRRSAEGWIDEGRVPGLSLDVWSIAEASDGELWLGTHSNRVARVRLPDTEEGSRLDLHEATVTVFGPEDGLSIGSTPGSPEEALQALEKGHEFLVQYGAFTPNVIEAWVETKREAEIDFIRLRPHPEQFSLYFNV